MKQERTFVVLLSLLAAWIALDLIAWSYGEAPSHVLREMFLGTWGTGYGVGQVLFKSTPLLFTGLSAHLALRCGLFNIGAEGQLTFASLCVGIAGAHLPAMLLNHHGFIWHSASVLTLLLVGAAAGALYCAIPAILRLRFGGHEVLSTLLMNRLADPLVGFALGLGFAMKGMVRTPSLPDSAMLPRLESILPMIRGSAANAAIFIALAILAVNFWLERRSAAGKQLGLIGQNPIACERAGIPVKRRYLQAFLLSGAVAGLGSLTTVVGYKGYFEQGLGAGTGFAGIGVAMLGRSFSGMILAALFFGTLEQGGLAVNSLVPREMMQIIEGLVILVVALGDGRVREWIRSQVVRAPVAPPIAPPPVGQSRSAT